MAIPYNSNYDVTIPFSDVCAQIALSTGTEQTFTVPGPVTANYSMRIGMTSTANIYVGLNVVPVIPPVNTVGTQRFVEFRAGGDNTQRYVKGGDVVHFITSDATAFLGLSLRSLGV